MKKERRCGQKTAGAGQYQIGSKKLEHTVSYFNEKGLGHWAKSPFAPAARGVFKRLGNDGLIHAQASGPCHLCQSGKVQYSKGRIAALLMQVEALGERVKRNTTIINRHYSFTLLLG